MYVGISKIKDIIKGSSEKIIRIYKGLELVYRAFINKIATGRRTVINDGFNEPLNSLRIYGRSTQKQYTGKNLFPYPYTETTLTRNGITFTDNGDGTITANGTATADTWFELCKQGAFANLEANVKRIVSGCPPSDGSFYINSVQSGHKDTGSGIVFETIKPEELRFWIRILSGTICDNVVFKPMFELGTTATEYEPYVGGKPSPNPEYPQPIESVGEKVVGKNLWSLGDITFNGVITGLSIDDVPAGTYTFSALVTSDDTDSNQCKIRVGYKNNGMADHLIDRNVRSSFTFTILEKLDSIWLYSSDTYETSSGDESCTFSDIQLELGTEATEYEPYLGKGIQTKFGGKNLINLENPIQNVSSSTGSWKGREIHRMLLEPGTYAFRCKYKQNKTITTIGITISDLESGAILCGLNSSLESGKIDRFFDISTPMWIRIMAYSNNSSESLDASCDYFDIQIEEGSTITPYEPYQQPQTHNTILQNGLPAIPVTSGGNYTDEDGQQYVADYFVLERDGVGKNLLDPSLIVNHICQYVTLTADEYSFFQDAFTISEVLTVIDDRTNSRLTVSRVYDDGTLHQLTTLSKTTVVKNSPKRLSLTFAATNKPVERLEIIFSDCSNGAVSGGAIVEQPMIELGSTATSYEPYLGGITCGKLIKYSHEITIDGDENIGMYTGGFYAIDILPEKMSRREGYCNQYVPGSGNDNIWIGVDNEYIYFINNSFYDDNLSDKGLANFKAHLEEHPVKILTYLTTPTVTDLPPEEVQAFLELNTYHPTTIISNSDDAFMEIGYQADYYENT